MYDIAIIGAGPGGYVAAIRAASLGAKVALIERDRVGGVCLNRGCIPTKALIASSKVYKTIQGAEEFGISVSGKASVDMRRIHARREKIVSMLRQGIERLLKAHKIDLIKGEAKLAGVGAIKVHGDKIQAGSVIIAAGSQWMNLHNLKTDGAHIVTCDEALEWAEIPKRLVIVGGGVVGCEMACVMNSLGSDVTIVEATPSILPPVEREISKLLAKAMKEKGISIFTDTTVDDAETQGDSVAAILSSGERIAAEKILVAVGRRPKFDGLNLESAGVRLDDRGFIQVNDNFETSANNIYAIGDCKGGRMLAHAASAEGISAVHRIMGVGDGRIDTSAIPMPIFTMPEIASVGLTSEVLKGRGIDFDTGRFPFAASGKAAIDGESCGQVIVHASKKDGKLLGAHIIGSEATLIIQEAALAIAKGLKAKDLKNTIHPHPTLSEALAEASADVYGLAIHKLSRKR